MERLTIRKPDDFHLHLRQGDLLETIIPFSAQWCGRALIMPNTLPPILTAEHVRRYRDEIRAAGTELEPLMTIKLTAATTPAMIAEGRDQGIVAAKLYPEGVTTNSEDGVADMQTLFPIFAAMEREGVVLSIHAEEPGVFPLERERAYLTHVETILGLFPGLRVVVEHVSDARTVDFVRSGPPTLAATITVHHLLLTLEDVVGDKLQPHHFCKPIPKHPEDRQRLLEAALGGNPKFFLGTDSAAHAIDQKECANGCAGVFSAPVALPLLALIFQHAHALHKLEDFCSVFGARFYGLPLNTDTVMLLEAPWQVPAVIVRVPGLSVVPFMAGRELSWRIA